MADQLTAGHPAGNRLAPSARFKIEPIPRWESLLPLDNFDGPGGRTLGIHGARGFGFLNDVAGA